jgi:restriction system protein
LIKSGISVFDSRTAWAVTYLAQAGLIRRPKRAVNQITERGQHVLQEHPDRVDNHILVEFEEFREFKSRARASQNRPGASKAGEPTSPLSTSNGNTAATEAPRETITAAIEENNAAVAADILARVREQDPAFLENLVLKVLTAIGYGGAAATGRASRPRRLHHDQSFQSRCVQLRREGCSARDLDRRANPCQPPRRAQHRRPKFGNIRAQTCG